MQIFILERPDDKKIPLTMEPTNALSDLKDKLRSYDKKYQDILMLIYNHVNLEDDSKTLQEYSIADGSTIDLYFSFQCLPVYLDIETFSGNSIKLYYDPNTIISDIKKYLEDTYKVPANQKFISFHEVLDDEKRLNQYYKLSSPIFLCSPPNDDKKIIIIKNFSGIYKLIQVGSTEAIKDIKNQIQTVENIPADQQRLLFKDNFLDDAKSIQDYSLPDFPIILLFPHTGGESMDITVTYLTGKHLPLKVDSKDTIENLKIVINFIDQHPVSMQCLSFNGNDLDDDQKTLESYSVTNGSNIDIVLRYRG